MKLTAKQQKFIDNYLQSGNGTQAAIQAGYSENGARVTANRLLTNDNIATIIKERQQQASKKADFTLENWIKKVKELADDGERDSDRLKALDMLGKHLGAYDSDNKLKLDVDKMNEEDLIRLTDELMRNI